MVAPRINEQEYDKNGGKRKPADACDGHGEAGVFLGGHSRVGLGMRENTKALARWFRRDKGSRKVYTNIRDFGRNQRLFGAFNRLGYGVLTCIRIRYKNTPAVVQAAMLVLPPLMYWRWHPGCMCCACITRSSGL